MIEGTMILHAKNWATFQHYRDRTPAWIKLHKTLLDDFDWHRLPLASRALAPMLWLLASESKDGSIAGAPAKIAFRLHVSEADMWDALNPLIEAEFFALEQDASAALADCKRTADSESEKEAETEEETEGEARASDAPHAPPMNGHAKTPMGTRLPDGWMPDAELTAFATDLGLDAAAVLAQFTDYWRAVPGAKGRKLDWPATWRNWCRRNAERPHGPGAGPDPWKAKRDAEFKRVIEKSRLDYERDKELLR